MPTSAERQKQRNGLSANRNSYDDSKQQQQARRGDRRLRAAFCYAMAVGRKAVAAAAAADAVSLPMRPKGDLRYILSPCIATATG
jgi:hypothetical protein